MLQFNVGSSINQKIEANLYAKIEDIVEVGSNYEAKRNVEEMMDIPNGESIVYGIREDKASKITNTNGIRVLNMDLRDLILILEEEDLNTVIRNNDFSDLKKQTVGVKLFVFRAEVGIDINGVIELNDYLNETVPLNKNGNIYRINGQ